MENLIFNKPAEAVIDARSIINSKGAGITYRRNLIRPEALPESLRIPKLRYALVFKDHLSLVIYRNPDTQIGARIWAESATSYHEDKPTKYKDIYYYSYCNNYEESPKNIE